MTKQKKGLTLNEHVILGRQLKQMRDKLAEIAAQLGQRYPESSGLQSLVSRVEMALDALRCRLDDIVCSENPGFGDAGKIYYPGHGSNNWETLGLRHRYCLSKCCKYLRFKDYVPFCTHPAMIVRRPLTPLERLEACPGWSQTS